MKFKNPYILLSIVWAISTIIFALTSVLKFVDGNLIYGIILLCCSIACAFVLGVLFNTAHQISKLNEQILVTQRIEEMFDNYQKSLNKKNEPFDEFNVPFPEVKNKENKKDEN
jgi:hypothetical protein